MELLRGLNEKMHQSACSQRCKGQASSYFFLKVKSAPSLTHPCQQRACTVGHERGSCAVIPVPVTENGQLAHAEIRGTAAPLAAPVPGTKLGGPLEGAAGGAERGRYRWSRPGSLH